CSPPRRAARAPTRARPERLRPPHDTPPGRCGNTTAPAEPFAAPSARAATHTDPRASESPGRPDEAERQPHGRPCCTPTQLLAQDRSRNPPLNTRARRQAAGPKRAPTRRRAQAGADPPTTPTPHASALPDRWGDAGGEPHRSDREAMQRSHRSGHV